MKQKYHWKYKVWKHLKYKNGAIQRTYSQSIWSNFQHFFKVLCNFYLAVNNQLVKFSYDVVGGLL